MMMCAEPEGIMEQEAAFLAALSTAATYSINGQVLEMRTADDAMALRFEVATDSVVAPAAMASADPDPVAADAEAAPVEFAAVAAQTPSGRVTARAWRQHPHRPWHQYPIVGIAPLDTEGEIVGRSADGQWWVASVPSAPNGQGWVAAAYVEASNADDVPVLPAPPLPEVTAAIQEGVPYEVPQGVILYSASRVVQEGNRVYELEDIYAVPANAWRAGRDGGEQRHAAGAQPRPLHARLLQPAERQARRGRLRRGRPVSGCASRASSRTASRAGAPPATASSSPPTGRATAAGASTSRRRSTRKTPMT